MSRNRKNIFMRFSGKFTDWLHKDDITGKHSDTTLRVWLLILPVIAVFWSVSYVLVALLFFPDSAMLDYTDRWADIMIKVMSILGPGGVIGLVIYSVKRISERLQHNSAYPFQQDYSRSFDSADNAYQETAAGNSFSDTSDGTYNHTVHNDDNDSIRGKEIQS